MLKEEWLKTVTIITFIIIAIVLIFLVLKSDLTGRIILLEKETFRINEPIKGTLEMKIREGELIPSNTMVLATLDGDSKEMSLKEFVKASNIELEEKYGNFFVDGKELKGEGFGYGFPGHSIVYPDVYFQLKITFEKAEGNETNETEKIERIDETNEVDEDNSIEEAQKQTEIPEQTPPRVEEQSPMEENSENQDEIQTTETETPVTGNLITGLITLVFRTVGIWNSFAVLEENSNFKIIEAKCSSANPFTYDLAENEQVKLVKGSVRTDGKKLEDSEIYLDRNDNKLKVSTNYFESFKGFGQAYLGKEHELKFDLRALGLSAKEPGLYKLNIKLVYQGQKLFEETKEVEIVPGEITIKIIDKEGNIEDNVTINDTNVKLKIGKIKVKGYEKYDIKLEKVNINENIENIGITGGAVMEQRQLPESEINFISIPEDITIQIDKAAEYQTEVFAIEPSKNIEIESATITLEKTTTQPITRILECEQWNIEEFKCDSTWEDSGLEFVDNGTHISFTTNHFTAYIGSSNMTCPYYVNESVVLVEDVSCNGTAFIINANDVEIDCQGYAINYSTEFWGEGINNDGFNNVTIKNCIINCGSSYCDNAINFRNAQNFLIENNVFNGKIRMYYVNNYVFKENLVNSPNSPIFFYGDGIGNAQIINNEFYAYQIEIRDSNVYFAGNYYYDTIKGAEDGIYLYGDGYNYTIFNNTIVITGEENQRAVYPRSGSKVNISYNNITTDCDGCAGIVIDSPKGVSVEYNNISTFGGSVSWSPYEIKNSYGIAYRYASDNYINNITGNTIKTFGKGASGIYLYETKNPFGLKNVFRNNVITTAKGYGFDIERDCDDPYDRYPSDIDTSNLVEGKPVYYFCNVSNTEISGLDAGQIIVGATATWPDPSNLTLRGISAKDGVMLIDYVEGVNITGSVLDTNNQESVAGVYIKNAKYSNIYNNTFVNNYYGVYDIRGNNRIESNNFTNNNYGIVEKNTQNSQIYFNFMNSNSIAVLLNSTPIGGGGGSLHNVSFNNISGGNYGIYLENENRNIIEGNNLNNVDYAIYFFGTLSWFTGNNLYLNNTVTISGTADFYTTMLNNKGFGNDTITNLTADNVSFSLTAENVSVKRYTGFVPPPPSGWQDLGKHLAITNNTENSWILLSIYYLDSELGLVNESSLRLWKYNGSWYQVDSGVDEVNNIVYMNNAEPPSSIYTIMGEGEGDTIAPTITFVSPTPANNTIQNQNWVYVNVSVTDNVAVDSCLLEWQGTNETMTKVGTGNVSCFVNKTGLASETYTYKVYANDTSNNWNVSETRIVKINSAPQFILNLPANNTQFNNTQNINFNFTAIDDYNSTLNCSIYLDGTLNQTNASTYNNTLTNFLINGISYGLHNWSINCSDGLLSNVSETRYFTINATFVPLTITIHSPQNITYNSRNVDLRVSANKPVSTWLYSLNNATNVTFVPNITLTNLPNGNYRLVVYANDSSNNWSFSQVYFRISVTGGGGGGGGAYCGDGTCNSNENCTNCPEDCHYCGDGCCILNETYQNCWLDCCYPEGAHKPVLLNHTCCPGLNSRTIYDMNCVANQQGVCAGCEIVGAVVCVKCGNGICGIGENYCNCPQDCLQNITNCSALPKLNANIDFSYPNTILSWQPQNNQNIQYLSARILAADKMQGQNNLSNFSVIDNTSGYSWSKIVTEKLKFFQVIAKVKVGPGTCRPECEFKGEISAWYDPCTGEYLGLGHPAWECAPGETPKCCFAGTTKEGWYESSCFSGQPGVPNLIRYAQCEPGEYAIVCNQSSDVFAKFTQELVYNEQRIGTNTSINWLVYYPIKGLTQHNTEELLNSALPLDYIAYWQASQQLQFGSARGDPSREGFFSYGFLLELIDSVLPGQYLDIGTGQGNYGYSGGGGNGNNGKGIEGGREIVITGPFDLEQGHPYFIGATMDWDRWTYVGKVPERVRFEFKYGPSNSDHVNYIVLPLDTTIRTASQLCNIRDNGQYILEQEEGLGWHNPLSQQIEDSEYTCSEIIRKPYPPYDFNLEPGKIYLIRVQRDANWQQI